VSVGYGVSIGAGASINEGALIENGDWWISTGPQGSRDAMLTAVYSAEHGLRWWSAASRG